MSASGNPRCSLLRDAASAFMEQQTHVRVGAERELMRGRAARLDDDINALREKLVAAESARC